MRIPLLGFFALAIMVSAAPASAAPVVPGATSAPDNVISVQHGHGRGHGMRGHHQRGHGYGHGRGHHRRGSHH